MLDSFTTKKHQLNDTKEKDIEALEKIQSKISSLEKERQQIEARIKDADEEQVKIKKQIDKLKEMDSDTESDG